MSVYIITCRDLGVAKIGYSNDPLRRVQLLQTGSPAPITLEAVIPACEQNERELHGAFSDSRAHGEWFKICSKIDALVEQFRIGRKPSKDGRPRVAKVMELTGLSKSYASMIMSGARKPSWAAAIIVYEKTGWKHPMLAALSDNDIEVMSRHYTVRKAA